jgi:hypothetical protein
MPEHFRSNDSMTKGQSAEHFGLLSFGGGGWIRTIEAVKQQIYSLPHLTTLELLQIKNLYGILL